MKIPRRINIFRNKVMEVLTKSVGNSYSILKTDSNRQIEIKNILISRPNQRLGNQLLLTPLVQEIINTFPDCKIDLFVKGGVAVPVFEKYEQIDKIIQLPRKPFSHLIDYGLCWLKLKRKQYDLVINGDKNSSSGKLSTQFVKGTYKIFGDIDEEIQTVYKDYDHISKYPIYNLRHLLEKLGFSKNNKEIPVLNIKLTETEIDNGKIILDTLIQNDKNTICIYTHATGPKCYSEDWWKILYARLQKEYPNYNIIEILPVENISKISFKAPNIYSKDIREMGAIIRNTSMFISADNGIMHLASATLTPTIGFFSVTNQSIYKPYGNGSVALNTNETTIDDWFAEIDRILNK
ncbi:glycosyltransferase family 9 protein [Flavivirga rizhaonensis]|uniref:Lipopolysaccharide heptosyltransferase family protein n=1 Tax=Flavivirga rizhaonensis TaxID=2559571 RepID=A0A4S1DVP1_9FLAO|nr:glycosyltransferase family 9 protein [Flavivirga rizhaonensis]TGV01538.1 lipopolysaccharide heptosyltransferase family protein [Flavivirga rizhaonensis]